MSFKRLELVSAWMVLATLIVFSGCSQPDKAPSRVTLGTSNPAGPEKNLQALTEDYFQEYLRLFPLLATQIGDHRYDTQLGVEISEDHREKQRALYQRYLTAARAINPNHLPPEDRLTWQVFVYELEQNLAGLEFPDHLLPVNQMRSLPMSFPVLGSGQSLHPFRTVEDYDNFLSRVGDFERWVQVAMDNMKIGVSRGIVQPKVVIERTLPALEAQIVTNVAESIFFQPVKNFPETFSSADRHRLEMAFASAIRETIVPAYGRLTRFLRNEYLPHCRESVALSSLPDGPRWYAYKVQASTTTDMAPDSIFEIGQQEFKRLRTRMEELKKRHRFEGSLQEFYEWLEKSSDAVYRDKPSLVAAYNQLRGKVEPQLPKLFRLLPKAPYEIRPVEEYRENSAPSQYWRAAPDGSRPGIFYVNARALRNGPMPVSETLYLHEAMPGHHFQIALAGEQENLPQFRRFGGYGAYIEGWGLYAELLGYDLGCFTDPLQEMLYLSSDMWRAQRLVVDVGLHHKEWSREQALAFMKQNPARTEGVEREVDRYIAIPGQALSYKVGQLKITQLRRQAEQELGSRFEVRDFHDELLKDGALPLSVLEQKMARWVQAAGQQGSR